MTDFAFFLIRTIIRQYCSTQTHFKNVFLEAWSPSQALIAILSPLAKLKVIVLGRTSQAMIAT